MLENVPTLALEGLPVLSDRALSLCKLQRVCVYKRLESLIVVPDNWLATNKSVVHTDKVSRNCFWVDKPLHAHIISLSVGCASHWRVGLSSLSYEWPYPQFHRQDQIRESSTDATNSGKSPGAIIVGLVKKWLLLLLSGFRDTSNR